MRNIIVVIIIVAVLSCSAAFFDIYISDLTDEMLELLEKTDTLEEVLELNEAWDNHSAVTELIVDHGEFDLLNEYLWAMQTDVDENHDDFLKSKKLAEKAFLHIKERNVFGWNNIF